MASIDRLEEASSFWFNLAPSQWFEAAPELDEAIRRRFYRLYQSVRARGAAPVSAEQSVATVIVLDQFPRNMFRGTAAAYATDALALEVAQSAVEAGLDQDADRYGRLFLLMPYQHSEDPAVQRQSVELFAALGVEEWYQSALQHRAIIDRFGRFPHRNAILGRASSQAEVEFLATARAFR